MFLNLPFMGTSTKYDESEISFDDLDDLLRTSGSSKSGPADADIDYNMFINYGTDDDPLYGFELDDLLRTSGPSTSGPADADIDYNMFDKSASSRPNLFQRVMSSLGINVGNSPIGGTLAALALASALRDRGKFSPKVPQVGYQGEVPKLTAIRERIERDDTGRRPGSAGRRYFSDVIYAKRPEGEERMTVEEARAAAKKQAEGLARGGSVLQGGGYLEGDSDGQADLVKGNIDGVQEARLSHGEFVLPADVVAMLGNGNSDAGADALQDFMKSVRTKATGNPKQQKNIDADKVLAMLSKRAKA